MRVVVLYGLFWAIIQMLNLQEVFGALKPCENRCDSRGPMQKKRSCISCNLDIYFQVWVNVDKPCPRLVCATVLGCGGGGKLDLGTCLNLPVPSSMLHTSLYSMGIKMPVRWTLWNQLPLPLKAFRNLCSSLALNSAHTSKTFGWKGYTDELSAACCVVNEVSFG